MNDLQIKYFLVAAKKLSFTKTAEDFEVSQPAISRQMSTLEKELEVKYLQFFSWYIGLVFN